MITFCTYCSAVKDPSPGLIPAIERYQSDRIRAVYAAALNAGAKFQILSGKFGLVAPCEPLPDYDHLLQDSEVSSHSARVAGQLTGIQIEKLIFFSVAPETDGNVRPYLDCIAAAAKSAGVQLDIVSYPLTD